MKTARFGPKRLVLFQEIGRVKNFYHSPARIVDCVSKYIFLILKTTTATTVRIQRAKDSKEENRIPVDTMISFALCTFIYF